MPDHSPRPSDSYSPLYFLASLGAGGLAVTFFMYLLHWVPRGGRPVPTFEAITSAFANGPLAQQIAIVIAVLGVAFFAILNIRSLLWNLSALSAFRKTENYTKLRSSNGESSLLAQHLALAMSVNAMFIVGLVFVPGLWSVIEYLFPLAILTFLAIGISALYTVGQFLGRVLGKGGSFDMAANNSFAQMMPAFALSMVAVGFSAPAAMSGNTATVGISLVLSSFFAITAILYMVIAAIAAITPMLQNGVAREAAPTLMVIVPLMTVLGILFLRQNHGLHTTFDAHDNAGETMVFLARMLSVQVVFVLLGMLVLLRQGYFRGFVFGTQTSPGSYALVCPGVAMAVMVQFFVNKGLVEAGVIDKFGVAFWIITAIALLLQFAMVALVLRLNRQHFGTPSQRAAVPAE